MVLSQNVPCFLKKFARAYQTVLRFLKSKATLKSLSNGSLLWSPWLTEVLTAEVTGQLRALQFKSSMVAVVL